MASLIVSNNNSSNIVQVNTPGPQGPAGAEGPAGPTGSSQPFSNISGDIWATTSSIEFSGSVESISGFTGSLLGISTSASFATTASYINPLIQNIIISGNLSISGSLEATSFTGSLLGTASIASNVVNRFWGNGSNGTLNISQSETITYFQIIPANTFTAGDIIEIIYRAVRVSGVNASINYNVYINTSNAIGGQTVYNGSLLAGGSPQYYGAVSRLGAIKGGTTSVLNTSNTSNSDLTNSTFNPAESSLSINWTLDQYVVFTIKTNNTNDSARGSMYAICRI